MVGTTVTLRFDGDRASGTDGCNRYAGPYTTKGSGVEFGPGAASTQMACAPDVMQQAAAYTSSLTAARNYRVEGGQLQLLSADGAILATFASQAQGLTGTSWRVTGYNNGRQAVVSALAGTTLTMAFSPDGRVSGSAGCNNYSATYTFADESLRFGPAATTRRMCADPERIMEQEQQFLKALETVDSARQEGDRLELRSANGALAVSLSREAAR
jgi:heat shock protein HslJ